MPSNAGYFPAYVGTSVFLPRPLKNHFLIFSESYVCTFVVTIGLCAGLPVRREIIVNSLTNSGCRGRLPVPLETPPFAPAYRPGVGSIIINSLIIFRRPPGRREIIEVPCRGAEPPAGLPAGDKLIVNSLTNLVGSQGVTHWVVNPQGG